MKNFSTLCLALTALFTIQSAAQNQFTGSEAEKICPLSKSIIMSELTSLPSWIFFKENSYVPGDFAMEEMSTALQLSEDNSCTIYRKETDVLGYVHSRYQQYYKNIKVEGGEYIVHEKGGFTYLANGC